MKINTTILKSLFFIPLLTLSNIVFSQAPGNNRAQRIEKQNEKKENIELQKIAFITKKLNLNPEEAQKFWPVYNQFQDKVQELHENRRKELMEAKGKINELSDKEITELVDNEIISRQKEVDLLKEYLAKFKAILPIKKIAKLYEAEEQFKRFLLRSLNDKQHPARD